MNATCSDWHCAELTLTFQGFGIMASSKNKSNSVFTWARTMLRGQFNSFVKWKSGHSSAGVRPTDLVLINKPKDFEMKY